MGNIPEQMKALGILFGGMGWFLLGFKNNRIGEKGCWSDVRDPRQHDPKASENLQ
jgi:hypothetical protein